MTPITIRERRENIAKHTTPENEAYPGQAENLLEGLIEDDARRAAEERELAAEARYGGRQITEYLQRFVEDHRDDRAMLEKAQAFDEQTWSFSLSPSGQGPSAERLARLARGYAAQGSDAAFGTKPKRVTIEEAEAMFDWPIYRAAR